MYKKKIAHFLFPVLQNKVVFIKSIISGLIQSAYGVINIFLIQRVIHALENGMLDKISEITFQFLIFNVIFFIVSFVIRKWSWAELYYSNIRIIYTKYMQDFSKLDNSSIENEGTGKIISILGKGFETWSNFLAESISIITKLIVSIIATFLILKNLGNSYLYLFICAFIVTNIILYILNQKSLKYRTKLVESRIGFDRQFVRMIMSKFEILQNNKNDNEIRNLNSHINDSVIQNHTLNNYLFVMFTIPDVILFFGYLSVFSIILNSKIVLSDITAIFLMLGLLKGVLNDSIGFFKNFTKNFFSIEKVWDFFEKTEKNHQLDSGNKFHYLDGNIQIKKMNFSYGKNIIFKDFSLELKGGSKTALVGLSGSGKTTLVKLISGFLTSYGGDIIIDGQNLKELDLRTLYRNIGYLSQEPSVFDGKIIENLLYGIDGETVDDDFIDKIISLAHCEFIYDFQDGLDTEIGEKGVRLSGGQKQRIAIAKVFLKNPNIIILDEPTSALDSFSEELISSSFDELFIGKTVLIIAHRLQTVQKSNEIIVFDGGEVIERGSHKILIERNGAYKKMLDLQSGF